MEELIQAFTPERIGKSGTKFDINKAKWFNQQYLKAKSSEELSGYLIEQLNAKGIKFEASKISKIVELLKERVTFSKDFGRRDVSSLVNLNIMTRQWLILSGPMRL